MDELAPRTHDAFRGMSGSFARTTRRGSLGQRDRSSLQINTTFSRRNIAEIDAVVALIESLNITLWSVSFLVPTDRETRRDLLNANVSSNKSSRRFTAFKDSEL